MDLGISGLASGFDWRTLVDQLAGIERTPQARLRTEQSEIARRNNAFGSIKTQLGVLQNRLDKLSDPAFFNTRLTSLSDAAVASATASTSAANGAYIFNITQLATSGEWRGASNAGAPLSSTNNVSGLTLSNAGFPVAVTAGDFTVNGKRVTIATSDTLQGVFDKISTATSGAVTGSYEASSDKITFTSGSGAVVLGSATDTSNFLQSAKLYNNGTGTVASTESLGGIRTTAALTSANLSTAITAGAGEFKVNGVSINYNAGTDSLASVLDRVNNSVAGVTASYDSVNDRVVLRNKTTGDVGVALEDVAGNFLTATGLTGGSLERGKNLLYTVDGGSQRISSSNTISDASSGIAGLSVSALKTGSTTVSVASDTATIKKAVTDFLDEYNRTQTLIDSETASTTDSKGKVTAGILANDSDADEIAAKLRSISFSEVTGLTGAIRSLSALGIDSNGEDNTLKVDDATKLEDAIKNNIGAVRELFTRTNGVGVKLKDFVEDTIGDEGTLTDRQSNLTKQSGAIDTQVIDMERLVEANRQQMISRFVVMEQTQQKINQQLQFLSQRFGGTTSG